jgi:nucleoside-diphosphate-sugar epimerase
MRAVAYRLAIWSNFCLACTLAFLPGQSSLRTFVRTSPLRPTSSSNAATLSTTTTALCAKYKKVFVAGGSRGVGRCVIDKLLNDSDRQVVALVRDPADADALNQIAGVTAIVGDARVIKDVENAMDGCDAAITTLGGSSAASATEGQVRIDYEGNNNVIESAGILGVTRVILVTSIGCGTSKEAAPPAVFEVLKDVLAAKEKAENILIKYYTNMNWSIVRPGGLKSEPMTGQAILTSDVTAIGSIHREDVADLVVRALESPATERQVLSAIDPSITSAVSMEGKTVAAFAL